MLWPPPCAGGTVWNPRKAGSHRGPGPCSASSQALWLEPLHEEELTKGPSSVSLGEGQAAGLGPGGGQSRRFMASHPWPLSCTYTPFSRLGPAFVPQTGGQVRGSAVASDSEVLCPSMGIRRFLAYSSESWVCGAVWDETGKGRSEVVRCCRESRPVAGARQ